MAAAFESLDRKSMVEVATVYDIDVPIHENEAYVAKIHAMRDDWEAQLSGKMAALRRR